MRRLRIIGGRFFVSTVVMARVSLAFAPLLVSTRHQCRPSATPCDGSRVTRSFQTRRHAHILNTAFEWLAVERSMDEPYGTFDWTDPTAAAGLKNGSSDRPKNAQVDGDTEIMPLYPLPATHLPSTVNHTLNNVEPRNIQMAEDLLKSKDQRFCVVLRASDTGRIASVGTVMKIVDSERDERDGVIRRIAVKCQAVGLARIVGIENPDAAKPERRLLKSPEYLKARVRSKIVEDCHDSEEAQAIVARIVDDYRSVRSLYLNGNGAENLPPFAVQHLGSALPEWTVKDFTTEAGFWDAAQIWQTLCYTIREQRQMALSADRNEVMVAAACKKGGPLKLPIHVADLDPQVRYELAEMEVQAQSDFVQLGLDPCLDFQNLLCMEQKLDQLAFLSQLIARERKRLEGLPEDPPNTKDADRTERRGAWFEGFE